MMGIQDGQQPLFYSGVSLAKRVANDAVGALTFGTRGWLDAIDRADHADRREETTPPQRRNGELAAAVRDEDPTAARGGRRPRWGWDDGDDIGRRSR